MKKIVALVLSLVMALSLATVAFAGTGTEVYNLNGNKNATTVYATDVDYVNASAKFKTIGYYSWTYETDVTGWYYTVVSTGKYEFMTEDTWAGLSEVDKAWWNNEANIVWDTQKPVHKLATEYGIPCEYADAEKAVHENGRFVTYVYLTSNENEVFYDCTAKAQAATKDLPNCTVTQYKEDGYVDNDGNFYIATAKYAGSFKLNVDGMIVYADKVTGAYDEGDYVIHASHIFAKGVKNTTTGYDVATCLICKGEFACTNSDAVATKNGYKISTGFAYSSAKAAKVYDANKYNNGYDFAWGQAYASDYAYCWQLKAGTTEEIGTTKPDTTKDGVNSAKTFDAGIAMYVGMSLLSVAGSAVVIGKKKEF